MRSSDCWTIWRDVVRPCAIASRMSAMLASTIENAGGAGARRACAPTSPIAPATTAMVVAIRTPRLSPHPFLVPQLSAMAQRTALVTGASSGIGEAFAEVLASRGFDLVLTARRADKLNAVAARLRERYGRRVEAIVIDHSEPSAAEQLCAELDARGIVVDALVNNAGYGVPGLYANVPWETQDTMLRVMVVGVAELTRRLWPGMLERGYGRVINVASLAGLVPAPAGHTLYGATKSFLIKFSEALAREGRPHGVHVTAVCPGFTRSEFHDVTGTREQMKKLPSWFWLDAETVAHKGFAAVEAGVPVYVVGRLNRAIALAVRFTPQRIVDAVGTRLGRSYRKT